MVVRINREYIRNHVGNLPCSARLQEDNVERRKVCLLVLLSLYAVFVLLAPALGSIIRVKWNSPSNGPGDSWDNAYHTVQGAINAASSGDEIWVAAGTYVEQITLKKDVALYGGFSDVETQRDQRNWVANVAVLDGNQAGSVVTASSLGITIARIDGFTIRNGKANYGGGIYCLSSSITISNNTITGNFADSVGGGICCDYSSPKILNNNIIGNSALYNGGGIFCKNSSPTISNNTIVANIAVNGGGIFCWNFYPIISNNIVAFNSSGTYIYGGPPTLRNNCVYNTDGYNYSGVSPGTGDIQVDPLFVDRVGGNYHLRPDSPCIDAGYDGVVQPDWLDIDGQPRKNGVVDIGSDEYYPLGVQATISEARLLPDGQVVEIRDVVVTGAFDGFFYVESADRVAGIQVRKDNHGLSVGASINLIGTLATDSSSGERYISASSIDGVGTGSIKPLALTNRALGGGDWMWNPSNGAGQRGVSGGVGLNNIGLLVRTTGRVISFDSGWFVLDDGSGVIVKCVVPLGVGVPDVGSYVVVTGISSCERVGDEIRRLLRVRDVEFSQHISPPPPAP
jgi:hypothetical protein